MISLSDVFSTTFEGESFKNPSKWTFNQRIPFKVRFKFQANSKRALAYREHQNAL